MSPSKMIDNQSELIDDLLEGNRKLAEENEELVNIVNFVASTSRVHLEILEHLANRNFRVCMILSFMLFLETIYILWVV